MVGEIRDGETAEVAMNAAQTGHLVLSTLHTNDSIGAVTRCGIWASFLPDRGFRHRCDGAAAGSQVMHVPD